MSSTHIRLIPLEGRDSVNTPLEMKILDILQAAGDQWLRRREIAAHLGRRQLTPYDARMLRRLLAKGLIEGSIHPLGPVREEYLYRIKKGNPQNGE